MDAELRRARRSKLPLSLLMFDLDHFKEINDRWGHLCGDAVLATVGQRMNAVLRGSDLKCRYGGEEFLVLLPDTPLEGAQRVAETLRRELELYPVTWNDEAVHVTASFGVDRRDARRNRLLARHRPRGRGALPREAGRPQLPADRRGPRVDCLTDNLPSYATYNSGVDVTRSHEAFRLPGVAHGVPRLGHHLSRDPRRARDDSARPRRRHPLRHRRRGARRDPSHAR